MDSGRGFVALWIAMAMLLLGYAWLDFRVNPWLLHETHFTMTPDFSQLGELWHWGGRLLRHGAVPLLLGNVLFVSGVMALVAHAVLRVVRRRRASEPRISVVPASVPSSIRPSR